MSNVVDQVGELAAADALVVGSSVGPWRVEHRLGRGGMGDVYAVEHLRIGKRAAMKIMHRCFAVTLDAERVELEGWIVNQVRHPRIVDIFDHGAFDGRPYLVMERLEGTTLRDHLAARPVSQHEAIAILLQICDALGAAHAAGVVHRDLKPENLFVTMRAGSSVPDVKLLDWSIAKVAGDSGRRTIEGTILGTPDFLSPEQAMGNPTSAMTDVYALGVLLYLMFLGRLPFDATDGAEMVRMHARSEPLSPRRFWSAIPPELDDLVVAMLAKEPLARPPLDQVVVILRRLDREVLARRAATVAETSPIASKAPAIVAVPVVDEESRSPKCVARARAAKLVGKLLIGGWGLVCAGVLIASALWPEPLRDRTDATTLPTAAAVTADALAQLPGPAALSIARQSPTVSLTDKGDRSERIPERVPERVVARVPERVRHAVPTERVVATPTQGEPPRSFSPTAITSMYVAVGRELDVHGRAIDVSDLWAQYRRIRVYDALRTEEERVAAYRALADIESRVVARAASRSTTTPLAIPAAMPTANSATP